MDWFVALGQTEIKGAGFSASLRQYHVMKQLTVVVSCQEIEYEMHIFGVSSVREQVEIITLTPKFSH